MPRATRYDPASMAAVEDIQGGSGAGRLVVVGMHRSGTSALTKALHQSGTALPGDLATAPNNETHFESRRLTLFDEQVLAELGGRWHCPPPADVLDHQAERLASREAEAASLFSLSFPGPGIALFKDPRLCLLLPFWREVLGAHVAAVLVWRAPMEVAHSLAARDRLEIPTGLALWEYYHLRTLRALAGMAALVVSYDALLAEPDATVAQAQALLPSLGGGPAGWGSPGMDTGSVTPGARRHVDPETTALLPSQSQLVSVLEAAGGVHERFDTPALPELSAWSLELIETRRSLAAASARARQLEAGRLANLPARLRRRLGLPRRPEAG